MQKSAETTAAKNFASFINDCLGQKQWTPAMLYVRSNVLSEDGKEIFSSRSLQQWLSGKGLPKIDSTVAMAAALEMPDLIDKRIDLELDRFTKGKTPVLSHRCFS